MRTKRFSLGLRAAFAIVIVTLLVTTTWAAPREKVLHNFNNKNGAHPTASLIFDAAGNLYGTTNHGDRLTKCADGCGTVFELMPQAGGGWTEKVLHSFRDSDGAYPAAGLILDAAGNLYGTTEEGGALWLCDPYGCGLVFELSPQAGGGWTEKVLHYFGGGDDAAPNTSLIFDAAGNLYGTTGALLGGVFELSPQAGGGWTEKVLYAFCSLTKCVDGASPGGGLIFDSAGNLYGTTQGGGNSTGCHGVACGTVFELSPQAGGGWTEKVLHSFNGKNGATPVAGLIFDSAGNLYGTTAAGGNLTKCNTFGCGLVFELIPQAGGGWTEKVLHIFNGSGSGPDAGLIGGLIFDSAGNLYGTTQTAGTSGRSTVFELSPQAGGGWKEQVLHTFNPSRKDGYQPRASLIFDANDNLYGTTISGGSSRYGYGTVFEIIP